LTFSLKISILTGQKFSKQELYERDTKQAKESCNSQKRSYRGRGKISAGQKPGTKEAS
jgi:hypothetical protein